MEALELCVWRFLRIKLLLRGLPCISIHGKIAGSIMPLPLGLQLDGIIEPAIFPCIEMHGKPLRSNLIRKNLHTHNSNASIYHHQTNYKIRFVIKLFSKAL